jgi:hypothetical protein
LRLSKLQILADSRLFPRVSAFSQRPLRELSWEAASDPL